MFFFTTGKSKKERKKGFTVVELIVVMAIFVVMLSFSMFDYRSLQKKVEASNLAEDIALTLRQAQVYGISGSERLIAGEDFYDEEREAAYFDIEREAHNITDDKSIIGVAFQLNNNQIFLFEDRNKNFLFEKDSDRVIDERKFFSDIISISSVRVCKDGSCAEKNDEDGILTISFQRPYQDAYIVYGSGTSHMQYESAEIHISDYTGEILKKVFINSVGNIMVLNE